MFTVLAMLATANPQALPTIGGILSFALLVVAMGWLVVVMWSLTDEAPPQRDTRRQRS